MRILALDLGSSTGWAQHDAAGMRCGTWDTRSLGKSHGARFDCFARLLTAELDAFKPDLVAVEEPFPGGRDGYRSGQLLYGFLAFATTILHRRKLRERRVKPSEIKQATCGWIVRKADTFAPAELTALRKAQRVKRGRVWSSDVEVLAAMRARYPELSIIDGNAAIALGIVHLIAAERRASVAPPAGPVLDLLPPAQAAHTAPVRSRRDRTPRMSAAEALALLRPPTERKARGRRPAR